MALLRRGTWVQRLTHNRFSPIDNVCSSTFFFWRLIQERRRWRTAHHQPFPDPVFLRITARANRPRANNRRGHVGARGVGRCGRAQCLNSTAANKPLLLRAGNAPMALVASFPPTGYNEVSFQVPRDYVSEREKHTNRSLTVIVYHISPPRCVNTGLARYATSRAIATKQRTTLCRPIASYRAVSVVDFVHRGRRRFLLAFRVYGCPRTIGKSSRRGGGGSMHTR